MKDVTRPVAWVMYILTLAASCTLAGLGRFDAATLMIGYTILMRTFLMGENK